MDIATAYWQTQSSRTQWEKLSQRLAEEHTGGTRGPQSGQGEGCPSAGDRTELSGGQRPNSVRDGGSTRAENQGQPGAEMLSPGSAEASAPTKPGEGIHGERKNWEPLARLSALGPKTADPLGWPGRGRGVLLSEKSGVIRSRGSG